MTELDRRLFAFRPDLADAALRGKVEAKRFSAGRMARIAVPVADMKRAPRGDAGLDTQLLLGEAVRVFDEHEGWAWVQAEADFYVGYVACDALGPAEAPTHRVVVPRTFAYAGPDLKLPGAKALSLGSGMSVSDFVENRGTRYALLATGEAVVAAHLRPFGETERDYVAVAETLIATPYLWGGNSAFGIDCSGLVQLAMRMAGRSVLRDSDMQAATLGEELDIGPDLAGLARGDLVFWRGHVAIMLDEENTIHANGNAMMVSAEPLAEAVDRIAYLYARPTGFRRP